MTAQIAILNKVAIALASDSAVTMQTGGEDKVFVSANKLFTLSNMHPVGIMIYGNAEILGIPWETIVKLYRKNLGNKSFSTLKEYGEDFMHFLDNNSLFTDQMQDEYLASAIYAILRFLVQQMEREIQEVIDRNNNISRAQIKRIISSLISKHDSSWANAPYAPNFSDVFGKQLYSENRYVIQNAIRKTFENIPISVNELTKIKHIVANSFCKQVPADISHGETSGIVIAGFGESDVFPNLVSYQTDGITKNRLRYWEIKEQESRIGTITGTPAASIIPFAQDDMVITFMEGVNPEYRLIEDSLLSEIFTEYSKEAIRIAQNCGCSDDENIRRLSRELSVMKAKITRKLSRSLGERRQRDFVQPILNVVEGLPKDELAAMAEALVNLTKSQRKVSPHIETVGGAVDVAVISKGDGFVWIKRKFYFEPQINPRFLANYYKDGRDETEND
jgi:hypothetical protein